MAPSSAGFCPSSELLVVILPPLRMKRLLLSAPDLPTQVFRDADVVSARSGCWHSLRDTIIAVRIMDAGARSC